MSRVDICTCSSIVIPGFAGFMYHFDVAFMGGLSLCARQVRLCVIARKFNGYSSYLCHFVKEWILLGNSYISSCVILT